MARIYSCLEVVGFLKKMKNNDDTKSRNREFSRGELKVRTRSFDVCIARYESVNYCWSVSKAS